MDLLLSPIMDALRVCACTALADTLGGPVDCRCNLIPGTTAVADACSCKGRDDCGMAWVRLVRMYPSGDRFPAQDTSVKNSCTAVVAAVLEVGVYRCQPVGTTTNKTYAPPSPAALTQASLIQNDDALALHRAINCCDEVTKRPHLLGTYTPRDGGGCGGGAWEVTVQLLRR